ncbi:cation diffusion facilitator family transporter [Curvibacter lanceolatus]|uniref:cation diffusion facilitator family transporter n=1 Tax=Curvibacter lanceolatus TaxID=86182 RepID=UPI00037747DB|nr:cation diffusion facilitator family transporter [Curvibacter lanceolatus]
MGKGSEHALPAPGNEKALRYALMLTGGFMLAEVIGGVMLNSLALLSDAAHMFTDVAALAIALAAIRVGRRAMDDQRTFGYHRFEILAAAFNALLLFGVAAYILYEAWQRWSNPPAVQTTGVLVIAVLGTIVNIVSMRLLSAGKDSSLNVKGAYLEVWSDLLGSIGVIIGALVIRFTGWNWVDTVIAVAIGLWVLPRTWILLKETLNILLEGVPEGIDLPQLKQALLGVPGVLSVHELHVWAVGSAKTSLSAHVVYDPQTSQPQALLVAVNQLLASQFAITHTTVQLESTSCIQGELDKAEGRSTEHWKAPT